MPRSVRNAKAAARGGSLLPKVASFRAEPCSDASPADEVQNEHDHCDDENDVDESSADLQRETEQPKHEKDDCDSK